MYNDFAVFICTHGRPDAQLTLRTLLDKKYNGQYYLILDDTDKTIQQYIDNYGMDHILVFDKNHYINTSDTGSNHPVYKTVLYAKDAVEDIAKDIGLKSFVLADDDILKIRFRFIQADKLYSLEVQDINQVLDAYNEYLLCADMATIGFGNSYTFIGGVKGLTDRTLSNRRFVYNFIFRNTKYEVNWHSEMNEDSITPVINSVRGQAWLQLPFVQFDMKECRAGAIGGMTEVYENMGLFKQYAHFLLYTPSSVRMIHRFGKNTHTFNRDNTFPKILSDAYRRAND